MTLSGAGKQTQQPLFTVIITLYHAPSVAQLATSMHLWPLSALSDYTVHIVYFALFLHLHLGGVWYWILIFFNYIKLLECNCAMLVAHGRWRKAMIGGNVQVRLLTHNVLIVHTGPVYRMTAMVIMLVAPRGVSCQATGKLVRIIMIEITFTFTCVLKAALRSVWKGSVVCGKTATPYCAMSHDILETIYNKYP